MLLRAGDIGVLLAGGAAVAFSFWLSWGSGRGETVVIRAGGQIIETAALNRTRHVAVNGPLGVTHIDIEPGRARVTADPSPRQRCVKQGWLTQSGTAALCLPNQVSLEIRGATTPYDTLGY